MVHMKNIKKKKKRNLQSDINEFSDLILWYWTNGIQFLCLMNMWKT